MTNRDTDKPADFGSGDAPRAQSNNQSSLSDASSAADASTDRASAVSPASSLVTGEVATELACPQCQYSLMGLVVPRCPECGLDLQSYLNKPHTIPWERRGELGWHNAYWATVRFVCGDRFALWSVLSRPLDSRAARLFQWITALHALVAFVLILVAYDVLAMESNFLNNLADTTAWWYVGAWFLTIGLWIRCLGSWPAMAANLTGPTPISRQRGATLSRYGCAGMLLMWFFFALNLAGIGIASALWPKAVDFHFAIYTCGVLSAATAPLLTSIFLSSRLLRASVPNGASWIAMGGVWLGLFLSGSFLFFFLTPIVIYWLAVVVYSLL